MQRAKNILFGAVDIGYRIELYSKFIRERFGNLLKASSLAVFVLPAKHYKTSFTYQYQFYKRGALYRWTIAFWNFVRFLFKFQVYHFFSAETVLPRKLRRFEFGTYKLLGKRIVMHFVGSDLRSENYLVWREEHIIDYLNGKDNPVKTKPWQNKLIKDTERYADAILVSTPDLKALINGAEFYPVMLDLDKFHAEAQASRNNLLEKKNEIVILHCPSNVKLKGTQRIHDVLKKISTQSRHKIKLILPAETKSDHSTLYSTTRYELFRYYQEADIVIDQLLIGWYGLQTVEALALGKYAVCYIDEKLKHYLYPDCPIVQADYHTLEKSLLDCIEKVASGTYPGPEQIEWVRKYHTIENNHAALLRAWNIEG